MLLLYQTQIFECPHAPPMLCFPQHFWPWKRILWQAAADGIYHSPFFWFTRSFFSILRVFYSAQNITRFLKNIYNLDKSNFFNVNQTRLGQAILPQSNHYFFYMFFVMKYYWGVSILVVQTEWLLGLLQPTKAATSTPIRFTISSNASTWCWWECCSSCIGLVALQGNTPSTDLMKLYLLVIPISWILGLNFPTRVIAAKLSNKIFTPSLSPPPNSQITCFSCCLQLSLVELLWDLPKKGSWIFIARFWTTGLRSLPC